MNNLEKLQKERNDLLAKAREILKSENISPEQEAEADGYLAQAETLKGQIERLMKFATATQWSNDLPNDMKSFMSVLGGSGGNPEAEGDLAPGFKWTGKTDSMVFEITKELGPKGEQFVSFKVADGFRMVVTEKQAMAIMQPEYKTAWLQYVRKGDSAAPWVFKAIAEGEDTEGGFLVPPDIMREILRRDPHPTNVVDMVRRLPCGSDTLKLPRNDWAGDDTYGNPYRLEWPGERADPSNSTDITWGEWKCDVHEAYMKVPIYRSMLEDASVDIEGYVGEEMRMSYRQDLEYYIINGNGVNKPYGILFNPGGTRQPPTVNIGNAVTADGLLDLDNALPPQYDENGSVVMNKTNVYATLSKLTKTDQGYVFGSFGQQDNGLAGARTKTLLGKPIVFCAHMPNGGAGNKVVINGDLRRGYNLIERITMSVRVEDLPSKAYVQVVARCRVGGQVYQDRALRVGVQS